MQKILYLVFLLIIIQHSASSQLKLSNEISVQTGLSFSWFTDNNSIGFFFEESTLLYRRISPGISIRFNYGRKIRKNIILLSGISYEQFDLEENVLVKNLDKPDEPDIELMGDFTINSSVFYLGVKYIFIEKSSYNLESYLNGVWHDSRLGFNPRQNNLGFIYTPMISLHSGLVYNRFLTKNIRLFIDTGIKFRVISSTNSLKRASTNTVNTDLGIKYCF